MATLQGRIVSLSKLKSNGNNFTMAVEFETPVSTVYNAANANSIPNAIVVFNTELNGDNLAIIRNGTTYTRSAYTSYPIINASITFST